MVYLPWIVVAVAVSLIVFLVIPARKKPASAADAGKNAGSSSSTLPVTKSRLTRGPSPAARNKTSLRERLIHAGFYQDNFLPVLRMMRFVMLGLIVFIGYLLSTFGLVSTRAGLFLGLLGGAFATIAPGFYLDFLKRRRQLAMQRALPDALDVIVVSLEGGLPVAASFSRVSTELAGAHPLLAIELTIVQREVQMGRSLGEAILNMAARFDLDDLRSMASVIQQSERYGSGVTRAFRVFADGLRQRRQQRAEEMARKASVKLVFPTVMFIFPAMFVVILAPAVLQLLEVLRSLNADMLKPPI